MTAMTPGMFCGPVDHDWQPDPGRRDEGLACARCGVTEAELDAMENGGDPHGSGR